jgi:hypothetical protein
MEQMGLDPERYVVGNELNSINPVTGMPEFFFSSPFKAVKKVFKSAVKLVKKLAPIVLPIAAAAFGVPFLGPAFGAGTFGAAALGSGIGSLAGGGSLKDAFKAAAYGGGTSLAMGELFSLASGKDFGASFGPSFTGKTPIALPGGGTGFRYAASPFAGGPAGAASRAQMQALGGGDLGALFGGGQAPVFDVEGTQQIGTQVGGSFIDPGKFVATPVSSTVAVPTSAASMGSVPGMRLMTPPPVSSTVAVPTSRAPGSIFQAHADRTAVPSVVTGAPGSADTVTDTVAEPSFWDTVGDVAFRGGSTQAELDELGKLAGEAYKANTPYRLQTPEGFAAAVKAGADPGFIAKYGPLVAGGLGLASLTGAFEPGEIEEVGPGDLAGYTGLTGAELFEADSEEYTLANLNPFATPPDPNVGVQTDYPLFGAHGGSVNYPRKAGYINGPGTGTSDEIPAMLSDGEFVMTKRAVDGAGGPRTMYNMMRNFEMKS